MKKILVALLAFSALTFAETPTQKEMIHDLEVAKQHFATKYAPKEWKKERFGWNLETSFLTAKNKILKQQPQTMKAYQQIFKDFLFSTQDYHVNVRFFSTGLSWFPLSVRSFNGHYYITQDFSRIPNRFFLFEAEPVDLAKFEEDLQQLVAGDEIIAINGMPIRQAIEQIIGQELGGDRTPTGYALAEKLLFTRQEETSNSFTLNIMHKNSKKELTLPWIRIREWIKEPPLPTRETDLLEARFDLPGKMRNPKKAAKQISQLLQRDFSVKNVNPLLFQKFEADDEEQSDSRQKGFLPDLGEVLWETEKDRDLYAYLFQNAEGHKIGYIYLESFDPLDGEEMVDNLIEVITLLEEESEALVFDITNNPGGDPFYLYGVLSTLTDKALVCPTQIETLIQEDLFDYLLTKQLLEHIKKSGEEEEEESDLPNLAGFVVDDKVIQDINEYVKSVLKSWAAGQRISQSLPLYGITEIRPHPKAHYTKPILVLINELDFSCADLFPAILQDNQRAVLFGKKTAGAGGYVRPYRQTSRFGIASYSITGSLLTRSNGQVIENLGVSPDISYELSLKDIRENYPDYIKRVNKEINKLI